MTWGYRDAILEVGAKERRDNARTPPRTDSTPMSNPAPATSRTAGRQGSLFTEKRGAGAQEEGQTSNKEETDEGDPSLIIPSHQKPHILAPRVQRGQRRAFRRWRQKQANKEWKRYVDRRLPTYSVDGYKDNPHRKQSLHAYGVDQARKKGWGDAISQKKASLRKKWRLSEWQDIRVRSFRRRVR
jgi:hypothetical protein